MNQDFKHLVSGPYQPVEWKRSCCIPVSVASVSSVFEIVNIYYAILMWRGHASAMSDSAYYAGVAMGEIDEPREPKKSYNPLFMAGFFAIDAVLGTVREAAEEKSTLDPRKADILSGVIVQLLFALRNDDDALAQYARYQRTGYLGTPNDQDRELVSERKEFISKLCRRGDEIQGNFKSGAYEVPLQTPYAYDSESNRSCWSDPIRIPTIKYEEIDHE